MTQAAPEPEVPMVEGGGRQRPRGVYRGLDQLFRTALIIIPIGVIGNIAFSLLVTDRSLLASLADLPRAYLLLALALSIVPWFTSAVRLIIWTRFLGHPLSYRESFQITLATDLGAAVSPAAVGGGFFKWGLLVQRGVSPGTAASLSTLAPLEDGFFFLLAVPVGILISASWSNPVFAQASEQVERSALPVLLVMAAIALFTWLAVRGVLGGTLGQRTQRRGLRLAARLRRKLRSTWLDAREVYRLIRVDGKSRFALSITLTGIGWIARYSVISALVAFLGAPVQPVLFWVLQWVVFTLAAFIPTPGGAGGAEAAFFLLYSPFLPPSILALTTAGWRFLTFYLLLLIAAILHLLLSAWAKRTSPAL